MFPNENELDSRICRKSKKTKLKLKQKHNQTLKQKPKFMLTICCADTSLICLIPFRRVSMCVCVYRPSRVDCRPTNYRPPHNYTELDSFLLSLRFKCKISICNWYTIHPFALLQRTNLIWGFHQKKKSCIQVLERGSSSIRPLCDPSVFLASHCLWNVHNLKVQAVIVFCVFGITLSGSVRSSHFLAFSFSSALFFFAARTFSCACSHFYPFRVQHSSERLLLQHCVSFLHQMSGAYISFVVVRFTFRKNRNRNTTEAWAYTHIN